MRRILIILGGGAVALILAAALALVLLLNTGGGRAFLVSLVEPPLGEALSSEAKIGALEGRLPGEIVLRNVTFSAEDETWLAVEEIVMRWRPLALLSGQVAIHDLAVNGALLSAPPPGAPDEGPRETAPLRLPDALPDVSISRLSLTRIRLADEIAGRAIGLDGEGSLDMGGRALALRFDATSAEGGDRARLSIAFDPREDSGALDISIASPADGFIASLFDLGGPLNLTADGAAPLSAFRARIAGVIGAYGAIDGFVGGDLVAANALHLDTTVRLGERLADIADELGPELSLAAGLAEQRNGARLTIERFETEALSLSGAAAWTTRGDSLRTLTAEIDAAFAEHWRPDAQKWIGEEARLTLSARRRAADYGFEATMTTPRGALLLNDGRTDLKDAVRGLATLDFDPGEDAPAPLRDGVAAQAALTFLRDERLSLRDLTLSIDDGSEATGAGAFDFAEESLSFDGDLRLAPSTIAAFAPNVAASGPVTARVSLSGRVDDLEARIDLAAPALMVDDNAVPALTASIRASGFPDALAADVVGRAADGRGRIDASIRQTADGYALDPLRAQGRGFTLSGRALLDPERERATLDLRYAGEEEAEPWPGLNLSGAFTIAGALGRDESANELTLTAENIASDDFFAQRLTARAGGPSSALRLTVDGQGLVAPEVGPIDAVTLAALVDLGEPVTVRLSQFDAAARGIEASLEAPATLRFGESIEIDNLRANLGRRGSLALDASVSPTHWRAVASGDRLPAADGAVSLAFAIDLDTARETPATGDFMARSLLTDFEDAAVGGQFVWDGATVRITNTDPADPIEIDLRVPARLVRSPSLTVDTSGALAGAARYEGRVEPLAAYLPPTLQSLEGRLAGDVTIAGTIENPEIAGHLNLSEGSYTELVTGLGLAGVRLDAEARAIPGGTLVTFTAGARGARQTNETILAEGRVTLNETPSVESVVRLDGAAFSAGPVTSTTASGEVTLAGPLDRIAARGEITVSELDAEIITPAAPGLVDIEVVALNNGGDEIVQEPAPVAPPLLLDIAVNAPGRLFVRGRGLESEWRADIRATGDAAEPVILGAMNMVRGYIDFAGRRFTITRGQIAFDRLSPNNPALNIRAEYETSEGVVAAIEIRGRAMTPAVSLVSTPAMPSEDIMAIVLFGKPASELSAMESLQIAQALASLGGIGPFGGGGGLTGGARRALGLDMLNVDFDSASGASALEVGKYVADGLFVSATQDARGQAGAVRVEYQVTRSISVETEIRQDGDQKVSANWKRDF